MKKYNRVYLEITNICNKSCSFCPGTKRSPRRMTRDEFTTLITKLRPATDYLYLHVMGEPLSHPDVVWMIKEATEMGFKVAITTNGTLLDRVMPDILDSGIYKVNLSVHSFERGNREEYLSYLNSIIDFADMASDRGILTVLRLWNRGYDEQRNISVIEELKSRFGADWVEGTQGARIRPKLHLEYGDRFEWPDMRAEDYGDRVFCHGLGDHFGVLVDGTVIPCCLDREGVISLGNLFDSPLEYILQGERATAMTEGFRSKRATEELCRRCGYARRFKV